jgi:hypothetical protein
MVVEARVGELAIITNGSSGYLVVEVLGSADTYAEAQEILEAEQEIEDEDELEDDEDEWEEDDE